MSHSRDPLPTDRMRIDEPSVTNTEADPPSTGLSTLWERYLFELRDHGIAIPRTWQPGKRGRATVADEQALYRAAPSFVDMLKWAEYLPEGQCLLLDDAASVAAFFELTSIGTEGREPQWLGQARDALENALQDSFDELDNDPWVVQIFAQDETRWDSYLRSLRQYIHPRARETAFSRAYVRRFEHHLQGISKPGGLFKDTAVSQLPWRGQIRTIRLVVYRRARTGSHRSGESPIAALATATDRLTRALANAGIHARRMAGADIHSWLIRWFNPHPTALGTSKSDQERFYEAVSYPPASEPGELELASGTDFAQRLFFGPPRSDVTRGVWYFDNLPHRVVVLDRLRTPPVIGHLTGERRTGGNALNALFDQLPESTVLCLTMLVTPQDTLEAHLLHLSKKAVGDTLDSQQTRQDIQEARSLIGRSHKLYQGALAFYLQGADLEELDSRTRQLTNVMLNAGLQPVREEDEVAPLNTYLRWLPCGFDPAKDPKHRYTQFMFVQHIANLAPMWGRGQGTGHPGLTFFNRGGGPITVDPLNRLDRQMNAHVFLFGPTGSGKSATLNDMLNQVTAVHRPRLFIVEAGNSFGLFGDYAQRQGLTVHRVKLAPGSGVSLAPFADARRLVDTPSRVYTLDVEALEDRAGIADDGSDDAQQRDILGELEITARLMITGAEDREEARMTRADRSLLRQCILDAARECASRQRVVLPEDVRNALRIRSADSTLPQLRRDRLLEMADAMDMFCTGANGEMFNRPGTPWPEADITIVDLATFAREGYTAELCISYISLFNTVNNIAERDQFLGRHGIFVADEGHIVLKIRLLAEYNVKGIKMWRKLGWWFWLSTQVIEDVAKTAEALLNMFEWWICLSMPPDEIERLAHFRELSPAQKTLLLSARKESGKFSEGVILAKTLEVLIRAVPPSLHLALAGTELDEKNQRHELMNRHGINEIDAALLVADQIDRARGIEPLPPTGTP